MVSLRFLYFCFCNYILLIFYLTFFIFSCLHEFLEAWTHTHRGNALQIESEPDFQHMELYMLVLRGKTRFFHLVKKHYKGLPFTFTNIIVANHICRSSVWFYLKTLKSKVKYFMWSMWRCTLVWFNGNIWAISLTLMKNIQYDL